MAARRRAWTLALTGLALVLCAGAVAPASAAQETTRPSRTGGELYLAACAACHGADGTGLAIDRVGFDTPLPDFTSCTFASREAAADWFAVAHAGGPVRAFDRRMPAFGDAMSEDEIARTIEHVRGFCSDSTWPRGELNLPRPLFTEKAFPEDEAVVTTTVGTGPGAAVTNQFLYERRFGARNQIEIAVPLASHRPAGGAWLIGLGDVAVAVKRVLAHSLRRGSILSASGELVLPTGKETQGLGKGVAVFEPFLTAGQMLPGNMFLQAQAGAELPADQAIASRELFWRFAAGKSIDQGQFGRVWSPMFELLAARELGSGGITEWDAVPQVQVSLSRRQHVLINAGIRVPLTSRSARHMQIGTYVLWDWYDGGLRDGWR